MDQKTKDKIDNLSHEEMARLWRFAPAGHKFFKEGEVHEYFKKRFAEFGGMTYEISKRIGWDG